MVAGPTRLPELSWGPIVSENWRQELPIDEKE